MPPEDLEHVKKELVTVHNQAVCGAEDGVSSSRGGTAGTPQMRGHFTTCRREAFGALKGTVPLVMGAVLG